MTLIPDLISQLGMIVAILRKNGLQCNCNNDITAAQSDRSETHESNGSTALHTTTFYGHHDIVRLLLANGCTAWIRNKYNNTPYDEAQDEEMRQLFRRPLENNESNRFASTTDDCFSGVTRAERGDDDDDDVPKGWVDGYKHTGSDRKQEKTVQKIVHAQMMKYCLKKFQVSNTCKDVHKLLKKAVPEGNANHQEAKRVFDKFRGKQDVGELIRVYTMQTPFYDALLQNVDSFVIELYSRLNALQDRAFQGGTTDRGLTLTNHSIKAYRWAAKDKSRMIEIKKMTSTSLAIDIAIKFAEQNFVRGANKHRVLCELVFPKVCYTAIDLNMQRPIIVYPHEKEILLLPGTLFKVLEVTTGLKDNWYTIRLENVSVPKKVLMRAVDELKKA